MARLRRSRAIWLGAAAAAALLVLVLWIAGAFAPEVELPSPSQSLIEAWDGLDAVYVEASLDSEAAVLTVSQTLTLSNRTGEAQDAAVLRTWPNAFQTPDTSPAAAEDKIYESCYLDGFSIGALLMSRARVARDGQEAQTVAYRYTDEAKTVLSVPVPGGWQAGEWITVSLAYTVQIPHMAYRFGVWDGIWALGNAFAIPAVWEEGTWRTDEYYPVGDPFLSDCMNWTVNLSVPEGFLCAATGYARARTEEGRALYEFSAPAVRDFALVVSDRFCIAQEVRDNVLVSAFATSQARARELLEDGRQALACFSARYGAYPYQSYTLCEINFPMGGMEYPGLAMIAADRLDAGGETLETVVAHETAHQWWYAAVGSNQFENAWQDEGLAEFSTALFLDAHPEYGIGYAECVAASEQSYRAYFSVQSQLTGEQDTSMQRPLTQFSGEYEYRNIAYDKGVILFDRLRETLGDEKFFDSLRAYARENTGKIASPASLIACFAARGAHAEGIIESFLQGTCVI